MFGWGRYGGYGKLLEILGKHLQSKGVETYVITWQGPGQKRVEQLGDTIILSFPFKLGFPAPLNMVSYLRSMPLYKMADADVYHNIDAKIETYIAWKLMPCKKHIIHFQDPYDERDYLQMSAVDPVYKWNLMAKWRLFATYSTLQRVCKNVSGVYTHALYLIPKIKRLFRLKRPIGFLPNPVEIPRRNLKKSSEPTVCFVGRWDPQKRVELFFELAGSFPEVNFLAVGKGRDEVRDQVLKRRYSELKNLQMLGFVSDTEKSAVLEKSWVLVNTSVREALPITFLEACAHKTAILSCLNPDNFASNFGIYVKENDFAAGLKRLLENDLWKKKGENGYNYVCKHHEAESLINKYINLYKILLEES